jgi:small subunit ribosomal protein S16
MLKIRLTLIGRHKLPIYRIIAMDSRIKRDGGYSYYLGKFDAAKHQYDIDKTLTLELLNKGAQPSETVLNLFKKKGI